MHSNSRPSEEAFLLSAQTMISASHHGAEPTSLPGSHPSFARRASIMPVKPTSSGKLGASCTEKPPKQGDTRVGSGGESPHTSRSDNEFVRFLHPCHGYIRHVCRLESGERARNLNPTQKRASNLKPRWLARAPEGSDTSSLHSRRLLRQRVLQ